MSHSCHIEPGQHQHHSEAKKTDYLLWGSVLVLGISYLLFYSGQDIVNQYVLLETFSGSVFDLLNTMAWGIFIGIVFVGLLANIPSNFVMKILGKGGTVSGILRATGAGVLLDLCSHGILMVGMELYKKGASLGQMMAFLIASPWNSFSLTFILWALVGLKWTLVFLILSFVIAFISGIIFDQLVAKGTLPKNPNEHCVPEDFNFWRELKKEFKGYSFKVKHIYDVLKEGLFGSTMVLRWVFFGVILASLLRTFMSPDMFQTFFGPDLLGLGLTIVVATILEVCSEGSLPIATDLLTRASAPGNSFAFLMTGVSTDYTEILSIKGTTKSWKIALFLPLVTLPQIIILALILNQF